MALYIRHSAATAAERLRMVTESTEWLSIAEASRLHEIPERTLYRWSLESLEGKPSKIEARRVSGERGIQIRVIGDISGDLARTGTPSVAAELADLRQRIAVLEAESQGKDQRLTDLQVEQERLIRDTAEVRRLLDQEQQLHGRTQGQLERLLPAPREEGERRPWWKRVLGR